MTLISQKTCALLLLFTAGVLISILAPSAAFAQCESDAGFVPLECFQDSVLQGVYTESDLGSFVQKIFVGAISFGAIFAVFRLAWAGFLYVGSDLWTSKEKAKEVIRDTFLGLFLLLAIWLILNQINPDILNLDITRNVTPPEISTPTGAPTNQPNTPTMLAPNQDPFAPGLFGL